MKKIKRLFLITGLFLITLGISAGIWLSHIKKASIPDYSGEIRFPGLTSAVTVYRDSLAIPHIYADNDADLYRATGFVLAQDRMWQMDLLRRITEGRLSEIFGEDYIDTDLLMRSLRIREKSKKVLSTASPEIREALQAYSDGINFYIRNHPLPPEFTILSYRPELWQPEHSINLIGYMSWDLTSGWNTEMILHQLNEEITPDHINELIPDLSNHNSPVFGQSQLKISGTEHTLLTAAKDLRKLGGEIFNGSNNWAVSGSRTQSGKPLLANDMHLGLMAPGIWYQIHQHTANGLHVTGLLLPGQPFVICGHNDSIAWGMTNVAVDDLDFYAETLNNDSTRYRVDGQWKDLQIKEEIIKVKGGDEVRKRLRFTHRGPLINRFKKVHTTPLSIRWIGNEMSNEIRTVYLLNRASDWNDFRDAVSTFKSVSQNIVYADVAGNIGLQTAAGVPIREGKSTMIQRGDTSLYDWTGLVSFEELPFQYNPETGYVSSANNKTVTDEYPYTIGYWYALPDRINRIREMLEATDKHDIKSFATMHSDYRSKKAEQFTPFLLSLLTPSCPWTPTEKTVIQKLSEWDYTLTKGSAEATVFEVLYRKTAELLIRDDLSPQKLRLLMSHILLIENLMNNLLVTGRSVWTDDIKTDGQETLNQIVTRALKETVTELQQQLGKDPETWQWGKIHTLTLSHPLGGIPILNKIFKLNRGPFEVPGSFHTVTPYSYSYNHAYQVHHGASHRHIYDLSDWDISQTVIPTGTSGIPASDHYLDQTTLYLNHQYHNDPFSREAILQESRYIMTLTPK